MITFAETTTREVAKIEATLRVPANRKRFARSYKVEPSPGETVAQFAARCFETHCGSIAQAKDAFIEIRVVAEGNRG